jgi:hypothetical protein
VGKRKASLAASDDRRRATAGKWSFRAIAKLPPSGEEKMGIYELFVFA